MAERKNESTSDIPPIDVNAFGLVDLIDLQQMQHLLNCFGKTIGVTVGIIDNEGKLLASSPLPRLCADFAGIPDLNIQRYDEGAETPHCLIEKGEKYTVYCSPNGLASASSPIIIQGKHFADLVMGIFFLASPDEKYFRNMASASGFDEDDFIKALREIPVIHQERLHEILECLTSVAELISGVGKQQYEQLKLLKDLEDRKSELEHINLNLSNEIKKCTDVERAIRESEQLLREITSAVPGVVFQYYVKPECIWGMNYVSGQSMSIFGLEPNTDTFHDEFKACITDMSRDDFDRSVRYAIDNNAEWKFEGEFKKPSGEVIWFRGNSVPIKRNGVTIFNGILFDITDIRRTEELLRQSEQKFSSIFFASPNAISISRIEDGKYIDVNPAFEKTFGYSREEIVERTSIELGIYVNPFDRAEIMSGVKSGKDVYDYKLKIRRKDDKVRTGIISAKQIELAGEDCVVMVHQDITERVQAEKLLLQSEEKYRHLVQNTSSVILRWDITANITFINKFGETFFGYSYDELVGKNLIGTIVPRTDAAGHDMAKLMEDICAEPLQYESHVNENTRKDGEIVWVAWTNRPVFDENGNLIEVLSVGVDITEQRKAQESLKESEEKLRVIISNLPVVLFVYDENGVCTMCEGLALKDMGVEPGELVGVSIYDFPQYMPDVIESVKRAMAGEYYHAEILVGSRWHDSWHNPMFDENGRLSGVVGLGMDVTERKQAEQEKKQFYWDTISSVTDGRLQIADKDVVMGYESNAEIRFEIKSFADTTSARKILEEYFRKNGLVGDTLVMFITGLGEAMTNAVKHAGSGIVLAGASAFNVWGGISDNGPGIPALALSKATLRRGYSTKLSMGLGYAIMLDVSDKIMLNTGSDGTDVLLFHNIKEEPAILLDNISDTWANIP